MAAGKARRATAYAAGVTPGVGSPTRNSAATAASTPATTHASADTWPCRMPISAAVSPSSAEALAAGYQDQLLFLGRGFSAVVPFIVMIAVLLVRPSGLFGTKELTRV